MQKNISILWSHFNLLLSAEILLFFKELRNLLVLEEYINLLLPAHWFQNSLQKKYI